MVTKIKKIEKKCKYCGCLFSFEKDDIYKEKINEVYITENAVVNGYYQFYLICPLCNNKNNLYTKPIDK